MDEQDEKQKQEHEHKQGPVKQLFCTRGDECFKGALILCMRDRCDLGVNHSECPMDSPKISTTQGARVCSIAFSKTVKST